MFKTIYSWIARSWESAAVPVVSPGISDILSSMPASSGQTINRDTVFALPAFVRGVDLIASSLARIPLAPYKFLKTGGKTPDEDHASYRLLTSRPNEFQTPFEFKRSLLTSAVWSGNGYGAVIRDDMGRPTDIVLMDSEHTWPVIVRRPGSVEGTQVWYVADIEGQQVTIPFADMIHLKGLATHYNGMLGMKLIDAVKESLGLGIAVIKYGSVYFRHSGSPGMVIELPEWLDNKEQVEQFRAGIDNNHTGLNNAHRTLILQKGAKLARGTVSNEDAQFLESRHMSCLDVANILGIPAHLLGFSVTGLSQYGSLELENLRLLTDTLDKWMVNLEQQCEQKLLTEIEKLRCSRIIRFDRAKLLQADHATNIANMVTLVNNGLMMPNDATVELNLPALPDEFNQLRLPSNVMIQGEEEEEEAAAETATDTEADDAEDTSPDPEDDATEADDTSRIAQDRLHGLLSAVLARWLTRVQRAAETHSARPGWQEYLGSTLAADHLEILRDSLSPVTDHADVQAGKLLDAIREELSAVTRDQVPAVFARIDTGKWATRIINDTV